MMKQSILKTVYICLIVLSIICALLVATYTFAQDVSSGSTTIPAESEVLGDEVSNDRQEKREERKAALDKNIQERIINLARNVTDRLTAGVYRMENIATRLQSRITKMKAEGYNTENAEEKLSNAQSTLRVAKMTLTESRSPQSAVSSDTPREAFREIKVQISGVRDLLKQTRALLKETVVLLKESLAAGIQAPTSESTGDNATTTESVKGVEITQ